MIKYIEPDEYGRPVIKLISEETAIARMRKEVCKRRGNKFLAEQYNNKKALDDFITIHWAEKSEIEIGSDWS